MARNLTLELILKARDYASRVLQATAQRTQQANQQITQSTQRSAQAQQAAITQTSRVGEQAARTGRIYAMQLARDRERLGMRSERKIQQEITQTIRRYERLKQSGTLTSRELARASEAARNRIRELNAEMGKTPTGQRLGNIVKGAASVVGGVVAAKHIITPAMNDRKQWDANVTNVALQAFGDKDKEFIKGEGIKQIQKAVLNTVRNVGGTHDQALGNLNAMMVNGMSFEQANAMLGQAQKMQVAGEANSDDIGALIKVLSDYGFKGEELTKAFEHALRSGMDGKFEIKDMVSSLPDILATASNAGFKGMKDFDYILSWLQSAADKAGSNSEAANNVKNTLNKVTATDTIKRLSKMENPFVKGKSIDLEQSLLEGKARGKNPVEVLSEIADAMLSKDAKYQLLQKQLSVAKTDTDKQKVEAQMNLMKGFVLSELLPDVQAKAGLNAATDKAAMIERQGNLTEELTGGLNSKRFDVISSTDQAVQARAESLTFLGEKTSGGLTGLERDFNDWKIKAATENPELFSAFASITTAFEAVAAGAGVAAVALWGLGGRGSLGGLSDIFRRSPSVVGGSVATGAAQRLPQTGGVGRLGKVLNLGGKALSGFAFISTAQALGEQQPYQQAQREAEDEKREPQKQQFAQTYAQASKSPSGSEFRYGGFPMGQTSKGVPLYSGYGLAQLNHDDQVAKARYEQGSYTDEQYQQRLTRNEQQRQQYLTPQAVSSSFNVANVLGQVALSVADSAMEQAMQGQWDSITTQFGQYHQDIQALANSLPHAIEAGLAAQSHTIDNKIVVELDGRIVAENTSQYLFTMANRG